MLPIRSPRSPHPFRVHLHSPIDAGLGPLRRMTTIAEALSIAIPNCQILLTTGAAEADWFPLPAGTTLVKLPSLRDEPRRPAARPASGPPPASELRRQLLLQVHRAWAPQVLIVDQEPLGLAEELEPILRDAPTRGVRTLLGLRDVFAGGDALPPEWSEPRTRAALLEAYDRILVFGTPEVFDPRTAYHMPEALARRLEFTGYLARNVPSRPLRSGRAPRVLFSAGGGDNGAALLENLIEALERQSPPFESEIVLGPCLEPALAEGILRRAAALDRVHVHTTCREVPELLATCDAVVSSAGYHSVVEVLQSRLPALLCPRRFPEREQWLRAERLAHLGYVQYLPGGAPSDWLQGVETLLQRGLSTRALPAMDGTTHLVHAAQQLAQSSVRLEARLGQAL